MNLQCEAHSLWLEERGLRAEDIRRPSSQKKLMHSGANQPKVLFVAASETSNDRVIEGPERELLIKIIAAMGLKSDEVHLATVPKDISQTKLYYHDALIHLQTKLAPQIVIWFGTPSNELIKETHKVEILPNLSELLLSTEAKKTTWLRLQNILKLLKFTTK